MIRQSERKSKEISQLPEAASNLVVYPELGLASTEFLQEMLGQKYIIASLPYGIQNLLQWLKKLLYHWICRQILLSWRKMYLIIRKNLIQLFSN